MRRIVPVLIGLTILFACGFLTTGCKEEDESGIIKAVAKGYWEALFRGQTRRAYEMLDSESQGFTVYTDYARAVGLMPSQLPEIQEYWAAYYPHTLVEVHSVVIDKKTKTAVASLSLTQPDPTWFPDEAVAEAEELGLDGVEKGLFVLGKQTEALKEGRVPIVQIPENTKLRKEEDKWRIIYTR